MLKKNLQVRHSCPTLPGRTGSSIVRSRRRAGIPILLVVGGFQPAIHYEWSPGDNGGKYPGECQSGRDRDSANSHQKHRDKADEQQSMQRSDDADGQRHVGEILQRHRNAEQHQRRDAFGQRNEPEPCQEMNIKDPGHRLLSVLSRSGREAELPGGALPGWSLVTRKHLTGDVIMCADIVCRSSQSKIENLKWLESVFSVVHERATIPNL